MWATLFGGGGGGGSKTGAARTPSPNVNVAGAGAGTPMFDEELWDMKAAALRAIIRSHGRMPPAVNASKASGKARLVHAAYEARTAAGGGGAGQRRA